MNAEGGEGMEVVEEEDVPLLVAPLTRARAANVGSSRKRKIVHRTSSGRRKEAREEAAEKAAEKGGSSSTTSTAVIERPAAQDMPTPSVLTPQVQVVNGRIVIDKQSSVVTSQASTREDTDSYRRVEEDRPKLNYHSYSNRASVERWRAEDTDLFYKALQQFGTDFELIQNLFPGRTRRQVKAKFKNEEELNPVRLADALGHKSEDHFHHYRAMVEVLKTEKSNEEIEDDCLLGHFLPPAVTDESVSIQQGTGTLAISSADKVDEVINVEAPANDVVLKKTKPDLRTASASDPIVSVPPESEVAATTGNDDPPASEDTGNLLSSHQSNSNSSASPLGRYGKRENPLGNYGKESRTVNPWGSYAKNPLGVYI